MRDRLPVAEGSRAIAAHGTSGAGDDAGGIGSRLGRCGRAAPLVVECVLIAFEWGSNIYDGGDDSRSTEAPSGIARAVLRPDGSVVTESRTAPARAAPRLELTVPARQWLGRDARISALIATADGGTATVWASIRAAGVQRSVAVRRSTRALAAGEKWRASLRLSRRAARVVRAWLARRRRVTARVGARVAVDAGLAPAVTAQTTGSRLR